MTGLQDLGFSAEEIKITETAITLFTEKIADYTFERIEKEGPCIICKNDDPGKCPFCPALPKKGGFK